VQEILSSKANARAATAGVGSRPSVCFRVSSCILRYRTGRRAFRCPSEKLNLIKKRDKAKSSWSNRASTTCQSNGRHTECVSSSLNPTGTELLVAGVSARRKYGRTGACFPSLMLCPFLNNVMQLCQGGIGIVRICRVTSSCGKEQL